MSGAGEIVEATRVMRTFVAADVAATVRERLVEAAARLRERAPNARWAGDAGAHLTLVFLGEIAEEGVEGAIAAARAVAERHAPFSLEAKGGGIFGRAPRARVLWAGVEGDTVALASLQRDLDAALAPFGPPREERAFRPHLTLARARGERGDPALAACARELAGVSFGAWPVDEVVVYRSVLGPGSARHDPLARLRLSSPSP